MSKPNSHRNYSQNRPREHQPSTVPRPVPTNETSAAYDSEFPSLLAEHQRTDNQVKPRCRRIIHTLDCLLPSLSTRNDQSQQVALDDDNPAAEVAPFPAFFYTTLLAFSLADFFQSNHAGVHRTGQPLIPLTAFMPQPANAPAQPAAAAAVAAGRRGVEGIDLRLNFRCLQTCQRFARCQPVKTKFTGRYARSF